MDYVTDGREHWRMTFIKISTLRALHNLRTHVQKE